MERPSLFTAPMVRAILDGTKTQTRRVVKTVELRHGYVGVRVVGNYPSVVNLSDDGLTWRPHGGSPDVPYPHPERCCPYGVPGDQLWVRETWATHEKYDDTKPSEVWWGATKWYRERGEAGLNRGRWRPSIYMPRIFSRLSLDVTEVRLERVQDISEEDARAEGARTMTCVNPPSLNSYREGFRRLWDSINAKRGYSWESNPWVWVVTFERVG